MADRLIEHRATVSLGVHGRALFSPCERYRYSLLRRWADGGRRCVVVMLNPSTADAMVDDPTIARCVRRTREGGFDELVVTNIFALRSTDPAGLRAVEDPVGPENDWAIRGALLGAQLVICAWGVHGTYRGRDRQVLATLRECGVTPHVLGLTKDGHPRHPLYMPTAAQPVPWGVATA